MNGAPSDYLEQHAHPCWYCRYWGGLIDGGPHGLCLNKKLTPVTAVPAEGCAFYEREPGVDDDLWRPKEKARPLRPGPGA
jgi:hypothetical protein